MKSPLLDKNHAIFSTDYSVTIEGPPLKRQKHYVGRLVELDIRF